MAGDTSGSPTRVAPNARATPKRRAPPFCAAASAHRRKGLAAGGRVRALLAPVPRFRYGTSFARRRALKRLLTIAVLCLPTMASAASLTPQEHAAKFCPTLGGISYAIVMGRQEGRTLKELLQFATDQGDNADLATEIVMDVWNTPIYSSKGEREKAAQHYGESVVDACWAGVRK